MLSRLDLMSFSFHLFNVAALIGVGRLWRHRYAEEPAIRPLPMQVTTDLGFVGLIALLSAGLFGAAAGANAFELNGLLAQWLLAELPLLLAMTAFVSRRARAFAPSRG